MSTPASRIVVTILLAFAAAFVAAPPVLAAADDLSSTLRTQLEGVMQQKVGDLLNEKDSAGISSKRGTYSRTFHKVDDSTYTVNFHTDTVQKATADRTQMKTERYLVTLKKGANGSWAIADQKLEDSYDALYRGDYGDGAFWKFDTFTFEREGLKVTAKNGYIYKYYLKGTTSGFRLTAADLAYTYAPPANMGFYGGGTSHYALVAQEIARNSPEDLVFKPERIRVNCDPKSCDEFLSSNFTGLAKADGGSGQAYTALKDVYDDDLKEFQKFERESPFSGFRPMPEADNRFWTVSIKRASAKDHALLVSYDNYDGREVSVNILGENYFAPIFSYNSEDVRKSGVSPYDLEAKPDQEERDYDLKAVSGSVDLALNDPVELVGDITYTMQTKHEIRELPFRISRTRFPGADEKETKSPKLFVNSIQDGSGNELTWVKLGGFTGLVIFPKPIPGGTEIKLRMQFKNLDSIYALNPSYSAMDRGGWLPFVRFADMIDKFDLTVRTRDKFQVLGIGKKVSDSVADGVRTTVWTSPSPVSFPTIIFGEYLSDTSTYVAKKLDGTPIPVSVYVDKVSTQAINVNIGSEVGARDTSAAVQSGARDIRGKQLQAIATQASVALDLYKEVYGIDYPFAKLDLVADPLGAFYGQAPASIIYLGFGVFRGEGALLEDSRLSKFNKDVVAHETGHQWWGSLICNANQRNYWFVESMAELSSALYVERVFGKKRYLEKVADWRRNILDASPISNVQDNYTVWGGESGGAPIANIYNKGPYAFHVLRETFGDEKFFAFLKDLANTLKGKEIVTRDLQDVAERVYGGNMEWFFDQWIRGIGIPQYAVFYKTRQTEDGKWLVEGTIRQRVLYGKDKVEMPGVFYRAVAPLSFVTNDGKQFKSKPLLVQGQETPFRLKVPDEPAEVKFNAEGEILSQDILYNRSW